MKNMVTFPWKKNKQLAQEETQQESEISPVTLSSHKCCICGKEFPIMYEDHKEWFCEKDFELHLTLKELNK